MKLLDILTSPWAIQPEKLVEIRDLRDASARRKRLTLRASRAQLGKPRCQRPKPYQVADGVALIPLDGVDCKRMNMFTQISGGRFCSGLQSVTSRQLSILRCIPSFWRLTHRAGLLTAHRRLPIPCCRHVRKSRLFRWHPHDGKRRVLDGSAAQAVYITDATTHR